MTQKHTPGPWEYEVHGRARHMISAPEDRCGGYIIASMSNEAPCREANARLIAAAPDLLAALVRVADPDQEVADWIGDVQAAIAKATAA